MQCEYRNEEGPWVRDLFQEEGAKTLTTDQLHVKHLDLDIENKVVILIGNPDNFISSMNIYYYYFKSLKLKVPGHGGSIDRDSIMESGHLNSPGDSL